jgi:hypothetical protein
MSEIDESFDQYLDAMSDIEEPSGADGADDTSSSSAAAAAAEPVSSPEDQRQHNPPQESGQNLTSPADAGGSRRLYFPNIGASGTFAEQQRQRQLSISATRAAEQQRYRP